LLIDCGLFQGLKELRLLNWADFLFNPEEIKCVLLTHAHLDHCGALPLLVRAGFKGPIFCTEPTRDLARIILLDSAKISEEDAEYANKKGFSKHKPALPLYTTEDVYQTLPLFRIVDFHQNNQLGSFQFSFYKAGHILGAASVLLTVESKRLLFSGDLGRNEDPLMSPPEPPPECDFIIMESTYGDRIHSAKASSVVLKECIMKAFENKSKLLIPSFAVGRAQNLIYEIVQLMRNGEAPALPVYLNTPMGSEVSQCYESYPTYYRLGKGEFDGFMKAIINVKSTEDSKSLNEKPGPAVIIAASGMLTGGRILHHLKAFASDPKNIILLAGFQSPGTRGWTLLNGSRELKIHGAYVPVQAQIISSDSFSAHADREDLLDWVSKAPKQPLGVFLTHGESSASDELRRRLVERFNIDVKIPKMNEISVL
jgi:metallo-beta-lactamase family protein